MTFDFSTRQPLQRRTFLRGLGASMALPLLECMEGPAALAASSAAAGTSPAPVRAAFVFFPNGCIQDAWRPEGTGTDWQLSETLAPLKELKDDVIVFGNLAQHNGRALGDGPGDHARCASSYLTGAHPVKTSGADIRVGVSIDQFAAERIGFQTRLPSLEIGIDRGRNAGNCDSGYSCAYSSNISWKSPTTPMAKEIRPKLVFERLFRPNYDEKRDRYRRSILDLVAADASQLQQRLGRTDRRKLDEYFTSVREIEQRIERAAAAAKQEPPEFDLPEGAPRDFEQHVELMYDLMLLAFRTDTTRVATFMLANAGNNRAYTEVGVKQGWHSLSHHGNKADKVDPIRKIDRFLVEQHARFLRKLRDTPEGEGTLLDNSMIVYGSGLGDGNRHSHHDLPILFAGRGGGTIRTGRHVHLEHETPLNNLFLSMMDRMGIDEPRFGDSTGRLKELA